jgi:hypothetical protein
MDKEEK